MKQALLNIIKSVQDALRKDILMQELPYSYHTFLFPFIWNDGGEIQWDEFEKKILNDRWVNRSWEKEDILDGKNDAEWMQDYAAFQYFTEPANAAIFNTRNDNTVRCFEYHHNKKTLKIKDENNDERTIVRGKYIITKGDKSYKLDINNVRLHAYDIGVAILILELENKEYTSLDAVNEINEYGRRINLPFLTPGGNHPVCADKIEITIDDLPFAVENYKDTLAGLEHDFKKESKGLSLNYIMQPIQKLLDGKEKHEEGYKVSSHLADKNSKKLFIKPCVDDRMFVCCVVNDGDFAKRASKYNVAEKKYHYITDCDLRVKDKNIILDNSISNEVYKFCYIETSLTCQSAVMKRKLLENTVYDRWIDYGTFHAMTHHSLVCVSTDFHTIYAFLTEYVQLAILVLAQRSAILLLSSEASCVAKGFNNNEELTAEQINDIEKLYAKYIKIQNQLLLSEATVQEQGVEIYKCIKEQLYIEANKKELHEQMNNLRDISNISHERLERENGKKQEEGQKEREEVQKEREDRVNFYFNVIATALAMLAIVEPLALWIAGDFESRASSRIWFFLDLIIVIGLFIWLRTKNKKSERNK